MKINVKVVPGAKVEQIQEDMLGGGLKVWVKARAKENEANIAVCNLLAKHFEVRKTAIQIKAGWTSRRKLIEILE